MRNIGPMKRLFAVLTICAAIAAAGCNAIPAKPADDQAAMRAALQGYLAQRGNLNMAGMDMDLQIARNDGRTADVNVTFRAKQGGGSMQMAYTLEKQGNQWVVKGSKSPTGSSHPDVGSGAATAPPSALPPAHPPVPSPQPAPAAPAKKP